MKTTYHGNSANFPHVQFGKEVRELPKMCWSFMGGDPVVNGATREAMNEKLRELGVAYQSRMAWSETGIYRTDSYYGDTVYYWDAQGREIAFGSRDMGIQLCSRIWGPEALASQEFRHF